MRLRQLLFSATVSSALMFTSSSDAARDRSSCDINPRGDVDFADAAFNTVGESGARLLGGNAFAIYAEPTTTVRGEGANRRRVWTATMVTAAHVIENVCNGYTPNDGPRVEGVRANSAWRLTLAPNPGSETDSFGNRLQPVEATLTADICQSQVARPTNPDLVPDLVLFEQRFELPLSVVMRPYVVGNPTAGASHRATVTIRGFKPLVHNGTLPVYNLPGLRWGPQDASLQTVGYSRNSTWRRVVEAHVFTNQSGSPIVSAEEPYLVYGVLTHQGIRPGCAALLARIAGLPQSGGLPQTGVGAQNGDQMNESATEGDGQRGQNATVSEDACRYNQDATNAATLYDNSAGAALLVDFLANYNDRFSGIVERQNAGPLEQQSVARIRAAVTLYELYVADQSSGRLRRALEAAIQRLTAIEQVRFMSMVSDPTRQAVGVQDEWMCIGRAAQDIGEQ